MSQIPQDKLARPFLTARWSNLAILSYAVEPDLLTPLLPPQCELDRLDDRAFVSLVAFDFLDTRVAGIRWPGFGNFPEVNLRMYVRHDGRRGVCFIREFVPSRWVSWIARKFYNEPYQGVPMRSRVKESAQAIEIHHTLTINGRPQTLSVTGRKPAYRPAPDSREHFFKEHNWGYGVSRRRQLIRYRVEHQAWDVYPVTSYQLNWDWAAVYGPRWSILQDRPPDHALLAVGSTVRVLSKQ